MNKTYSVSIILVLVGLTAILIPDTSTYTQPSGVATDMVGWLTIALAASTAAIRHAIFKAEKKVIDKLNTIALKLKA